MNNLIQTKAVLEEQIHEQELEMSKAKNVAKKKQDQFADLEEELLDYKKVWTFFDFYLSFYHIVEYVCCKLH